MRRTDAVIALLLLAGCATTEPPPAAPEDDGTTTLAQMRQVRSRVRHGEGAKVREELEAQRTDRPNDKQVVFLQNVAAMPSEASWQAFHQLAADNPQDLWSFIAMGDIYTEWKMFDQAKDNFDKALALKPNFIPATLGEAQLLQKKGDDLNAKAAFQALQVRADLPEVHLGLGLAAFKAGDLATAKTELTAARAGGAADLDSMRALAEIAKQQKDRVAAKAALLEVVAMDPTAGQERFELAILEEWDGELDKALADLKKAAETRGEDVDLLRHKVAVTQKMNNPQELQQALEGLAKVDTKDATPLMELAALALQRNDNAGAEAQFKAALARDPARLDAALALARLYRDTHRTLLALDAYRDLVARPNAPPEARTELDPMLKDLKLSATPIEGDVNKINSRFGADLFKFYKTRYAERPGIRGLMRIEADVNKDGQVETVRILEDTVKDDLLTQHAYLTMKDAVFPKSKRSPVFEYELKP